MAEKVTLKDVLVQVTAIAGHMRAVDQRNAVADEIHRDHEARIRMLEKWRYSLPAALIIAGGSAIVSAAAMWHS